MVALNKFNIFSQDLASGFHDFRDVGDTYKLYLTNTAPDAAADAVLTDLPTEIANGNGYTTGGIALTIDTLSTAAGVARCIIQDELLTATGGAIGPFRYACLYNDTDGDRLVGWYDYGSSLTLQSGESLNFDFHDTNGFMSFT